MSSRAFWPFLIYLGSCLGETGIAFKGTVTAASEASHTFDAAANPDANSPLEGADVELYVQASSLDCAQVSPSEATIVRTDSAGAFEVETVTGVGCGQDSIPVLLCIRSSSHETYQYVTDRLDTSDPMAAQKFMNIRVVPKP